MPLLAPPVAGAPLRLMNIKPSGAAATLVSRSLSGRPHSAELVSAWPPAEPRSLCVRGEGRLTCLDGLGAGEQVCRENVRSAVVI